MARVRRAAEQPVAVEQPINDSPAIPALPTPVERKTAAPRRKKASAKVATPSPETAIDPGPIATQVLLMGGLAGCVITMVALASFDANDGSLSSAGADSVHNRVGPLGAYLADAAYQMAGYAAWSIIGIAGVLGLKLAGRSIGNIRLWMLLGSSAILGMIALELLWGGQAAAFPPGGVIGQLLAHVLVANLGSLGATVIVVTGLLAVGTLLFRIDWQPVAERVVTGLETNAPKVARRIGEAGVGAVRVSVQSAQVLRQRLEERRAVMVEEEEEEEEEEFSEEDEKTPARPPDIPKAAVPASLPAPPPERPRLAVAPLPPPKPIQEEHRPDLKAGVWSARPAPPAPVEPEESTAVAHRALVEVEWEQTAIGPSAPHPEAERRLRLPEIPEIPERQDRKSPIRRDAATLAGLREEGAPAEPAARAETVPPILAAAVARPPTPPRPPLPPILTPVIAAPPVIVAPPAAPPVVTPPVEATEELPPIFAPPEEAKVEVLPVIAPPIVATPLVAPPVVEPSVVAPPVVAPPVVAAPVVAPPIAVVEPVAVVAPVATPVAAPIVAPVVAPPPVVALPVAPVVVPVAVAAPITPPALAAPVEMEEEEPQLESVLPRIQTHDYSHDLARSKKIQITPGNMQSGGSNDDGRAIRKSAQFELPPLSLLDDHPAVVVGHDDGQLQDLARRLTAKLKTYGVEGKVVAIRPGPVITLFEYEPAPGVKLSKISSLSDDLKMALEAVSVRIVAPIPGRGVVGVEIPNRSRQIVWARDVFASKEFRESGFILPMILGKDTEGRPYITDLAKMPHLLVGGTTGSGKSVGINTMLCSLLFTRPPSEMRMILVDPKMLEFELYQDIPHLLHPVVTEAKLASAVLKWACVEMDERYRMLAKWQTRNIEGYNQRIERELADWTPEKAERFGLAPGDLPRHLPYIVIVIDELADLMMVAAKDVEESIVRIAQKARAAGIHLIVATQRPSVDVITGLIKANMPSRLAYQVRSRTDGRTILDQNGAETLLGKGDLLFLPPGTSGLTRAHGPFLADEEVRRVADFVRAQGQPQYVAPVVVNEDGEDVETAMAEEMDETYDQAVSIALELGRISTSMIQRRLKIGYNRAARLMEIMEREGVVGPADGARPREVLVGRN